MSPQSHSLRGPIQFQKVIVCFNPSGNHSNRLFQNLHLEAFCYEHCIPFLNPTFVDMAKLYQQPVQVKYSSLCKVLNIPIRLLRRLKRFDNIINFCDEDNEHTSILNHRKGLILVDGWGFRAYHETKKHHPVFKEKYTLKHCFIADNMLLGAIHSLKASGKLVVGIHVRRGDYSIYENGAYYFSDSFYCNIMNKIGSILGSQTSKRIEFIIFSNEATSFDGCITSRNAWYIDHHLMMQCDYLLGPPSTFTLWASYMGRVPYLHITRDTNIDTAKFVVCDG
jgi:hypothetical protein